MKNNKGFSLVELIVVIAIMAILAAVAIPTFAHFITKANQASDDELLHNINYIFNAACLENGVDVKEVTYASWDMNTMLVTSVKVNGVENEKIVASFAELFDITDAKFKLIESIAFDPLNHEFVAGNADGSVTLEYGGGKITLTPEDIEALKNSTFGEIGMESLLNQLNDVTGLAAGMADNAALKNVLNSEGFMNSAASAMGIVTEGKSAEQIKSEIDSKKSALALEALRRQGKTEPTADEIKAAENQVQANAAVLYTAQVTATMTKEEVNDLMDSATKQTIINNMNGTNSGIGLAQASLMCGMYTSYVNSSAYTGTDKTVDAVNVLNALGTDEFNAYLDSAQGQADLDGYLASLSMINSSTNDPNAVSELMINGFNDPNLIKLMGDATK